MPARANPTAPGRVENLPTEREEWLLRAALEAGPAAAEYGKRWMDAVDLERDLSPGERRLLPLAYDNLKRSVSGALPVFSPKILGFYKRTLYYNTLLMQRLAQVIDLLDSAGVTPMVIKGSALVLDGTYANPATRVMADCDLLVPFEHKRRTFDFLVSSGFRPLPRWSWYLEPYRQVHSISLASPEFGDVDLHWFPVAPFKHPDTNRLFFENRIEVSTARGAVFVPCPELQLVHAITHGLQNDSADRVQWVSDAVHILGRHPSLDRRRLAEFASRLRVGPFVRCGVEYLADQFPGNVDSALVASIRDVDAPADQQRVFAAMNRPRTGMRDQLFLRRHALRQQHPGIGAVRQWWTLYRYWRHAAAASSDRSVASELVTALRHWIGNRTYELGDYRRK